MQEKPSPWGMHARRPCSRGLLKAALILKIITRGRGRGKKNKEKACVASLCWRSEEEKKEKAETKEQVRQDRRKPDGRQTLRERGGGERGGSDVCIGKVRSTGRAGSRGRLICRLLLSGANEKRKADEPEEPGQSCGERHVLTRGSGRAGK